MPVLKNKKVYSLEFLRGLASIAVLAHHVILAFFPWYSGEFDKSALESTEKASLLSFATNGTAAVVFFFLLSGFVLTRGYYLSGDRARILRGAVKRWPRLLLPVLLSVLLSWGLLRLGLYRYEEVGRLVQSPWLVQFAFAYDSGKAFPSTTLWSAIAQGSFFTFFRGDIYFNTNLWTMRFEFIASFILFGFALLLDPSTTKRSIWLFFVLLCGTLCFFISSLYLAFIVGSALAALLPARPPALPLPLTMALILLSLYLLGYHDDSVGPFAILTLSLPTGLDQFHVLIAGSSILILAVECSPRLEKALATRGAALIGELSFPLYLVHIPMISAVGCRVFLQLQALGWSPTLVPVVAAIATALASVAAALPLMLVSRYWLSFVDRASTRLIESTPAAATVSSRDAVLIRNEGVSRERSPSRDRPEAAGVDSERK